MPNHYYTKYSKTKVQLANKHFASGGEGQIYKIVNQPDKVAKLFYPKKRTSGRYAKLKYLVQHPPKDLSGLVWIEDILLDTNGDFVGYIMPKIEGHKLEFFCQQKLHKTVAPLFPQYRQRSIETLSPYIELAIKITEAVEHLHSQSEYVIGDLKPDNILIDKDGNCHLLDLDSIGVYVNEQEFYPLTVITPEYAAPEQHEINLEQDFLSNTYWDNFSLGIILYRLLFGIHPYAASSKGIYQNYTTLHQKIEVGLFVHSQFYDPYMLIIPQPHQLYTEVAYPIQDAFQTCFVKGTKDPAVRPSATNWLAILKHSLENGIHKQERLTIDEIIKETPQALDEFLPPFATIQQKEKNIALRSEADLKLEEVKKYSQGFILGAVVITLTTTLLSSIIVYSLFSINDNYIYRSIIVLLAIIPSILYILNPLITVTIYSKLGGAYICLLEQTVDDWDFGLSNDRIQEIDAQYMRKKAERDFKRSREADTTNEDVALETIVEQEDVILKNLKLRTTKKLEHVLKIKKRIYVLFALPSAIASIAFLFTEAFFNIFPYNATLTILLFLSFLVYFLFATSTSLMPWTVMHYTQKHIFLSKADFRRCILAAMLDEGDLVPCEKKEALYIGATTDILIFLQYHSAKREP